MVRKLFHDDFREGYKCKLCYYYKCWVRPKIAKFLTFDLGLFLKLSMSDYNISYVYCHHCLAYFAILHWLISFGDLFQRKGASQKMTNFTSNTKVNKYFQILTFDPVGCDK